jgi:asparagine synthase (glutamine-hydrolysing)
MSLIYGAVSEDNAEQICASLYEGIMHFPQNRNTVLNHETASFGQVLRHNTPEDIYEKGPAFIQNILFTAEARLDNRAALIIDLGLEKDEQYISDAYIVQMAYQKWGKECVHKLLGDWSFAAYHLREQKLFLARDQHGYTALYYHLVGDSILFGSSIKCILKSGLYTPILNQEKLINTYTLYKNNGQQTYFKDVYMVPPGHTITYYAGEMVLEKYWWPEHIIAQKNKDIKHYAKELKIILQEAIAQRLRCIKPIAAMLSGGLDSSTVAMVAAEDAEMPLTTISHVPAFSEEMEHHELSKTYITNEQVNIKVIVKKSGNICPVFISSKGHSLGNSFEKIIDVFDAPIHAAGNAFWLFDIYEYAGQNGFGTLLTGEMGNGGISYTGLDYLLKIDHKVLINKQLFLLKSSILKKFVYKYLPKIRDSRHFTKQRYIQKSLYLQAAMLTEMDLLKKINEEDLGFLPYLNSAKEGMLQIIQVGQNLRCELGAAAKHYFGIDLRDPTADINVLEYCLSVPNGAFFNENLENKMLIKTMMKDILPDEVLFNKKKGLQSADLNFRVIEDFEKLDFKLQKLIQNKHFKTIIDTQKLNIDFNTLKNKEGELIKTQSVLKTMVLGEFLNRYFE